MNFTNEQQKLIEQKRREIEEERLKEDEIRQKIMEHELGVSELDEIRSNLLAQYEYKKIKLTKTISKVHKFNNRRIERIALHENSCAELRSHLNNLQK